MSMDKSFSGLLLNCESPPREPVDAVLSLQHAHKGGGRAGWAR